MSPVASAGLSDLIVQPDSGRWEESGRISLAGSSLHYDSIGSGIPIVVLHKMGGWSGDWRSAAPLMASKDRRVIAFDLLAQGRSRIFGDLAYVVNIEDHAVAVLGALEAMEIDSAHFAGCSLGANVALVAAALFPTRVRSITLSSMSLGPPMSLRGLLDRDAQNFYSAFDSDELALPQAVADVKPGWYLNPERVRETNATRRMAGPWMKRVSRGISRCDFPRYLPRIACPTRLLYGEHGQFRQFEEQAEREIPGAEKVIVAGAASFLHEENPEVYAKLALEHIARAETAVR